MAKRTTSRNQLHLFRDGRSRGVWLTKEVKTALDGLAQSDRKTYSRLVALLEKFCEFGHTNFPPQHFDFQERIGGTAVYRFRSFDLRLYGTLRDVEGKGSFVGLSVDLSKNQNKANRKLLEKAAKLDQESKDREEGR